MRGILEAATASSPASASAVRAFAAWAFDARSWRRILYLVLALPLSVFYSVVIFTGLSIGLGVAILTLGLPLVLMMGFWRWMARFERWLGERLLDVRLPSPYRVSAERGWFARLLARTADVATWKDLAYLIADLPLALLDLVAVFALLGPPLALILAPFTGAVDNFAVALALLPAGLILLPIAVRALSAFAGVHAACARALLTTGREVELSARVVDLRTSQARIIAAADAERRRLERDLHDGAQQRLVAVALNLRVARERMNRGEDALELVSQAGDEAQRAIGELRDLARGIHPAVLTERGLGPALRDVAGRCPVPVTVLDWPEERFADDGRGDGVLRRLRGADQRRQVRRARSPPRCRCSRDGDRLVVEVTDDGRGGADPANGSAERAQGPDRGARRNARGHQPARGRHARAGRAGRRRAARGGARRRARRARGGDPAPAPPARPDHPRRRVRCVPARADRDLGDDRFRLLLARLDDLRLGRRARPARLAGDPAPADHRLRGLPGYSTTTWRLSASSAIEPHDGGGDVVHRDQRGRGGALLGRHRVQLGLRALGQDPAGRDAVDPHARRGLERGREADQPRLRRGVVGEGVRPVSWPAEDAMLTIARAPRSSASRVASSGARRLRSSLISQPCAGKPAADGRRRRC